MKIRSSKRNTITIVLFGVYILLLTGIILFKLPFFSAELSNGIRIINLIPLHGSFDENGVLILREIVQNILLFIPLGIYICMLKSEWVFIKKILTVIGLTVAYEVLQFVFALGISDITDIINNTFGGMLGIGIYILFFKIFKNRTVTVINILALAVTVYVVARFSQLFYLSHFVMRRLN